MIQKLTLFGHRPFVWLWLAVGLYAALSSAGAQSLRIAAIVNDDVISVYDVNERMRLIMFSANIPDTPEGRQQLGPQIVRSLIDEQLEMQEAKRLNISVEQSEYEAAIARLESQNRLPAGKLPDYLSEHGINPTTLQSQIRAALLWTRVVRRRAASFAVVSPDEVGEAINRIGDNMNKPSHLVAEIFLAVDAPEDEPTVRANIQRLSDQLHAGAGFVAMARQFSQSASAQQGGDLGWVPEGQLDPELDQALEHMQTGELSPPIHTSGGYYLLLLRDRRAPASAGDSQVKINRLLVPTANGIDDRAATDSARRIGQSATNCEDFSKVAQQISPASVMSSIDAKLGDMAPEFRSLISGLAIGHASDPLPAQNGVQVVMVCERHEAAGAGLPPRDDVERMLQAEKYEQFSRRLLRDLRQTAFVDIRV